LPPLSIPYIVPIFIQANHQSDLELDPKMPSYQFCTAGYPAYENATWNLQIYLELWFDLAFSDRPTKIKRSADRPNHSLEVIMETLVW